jgi:hypothetical protein
MPPVAGLHLLLLVLLLRRDSSERRWFQPSSPSCAGFAASQSLESADNFIDAGHFNPEDGACGDLGPWTEVGHHILPTSNRVVILYFCS